jgi:Zn-dependent protease with chaperone function
VIRATWFDGQTATPRDAHVVIEGHRVRVHTANGSHEWALDEVRLTPELGTAPCWMYGPDGSSWEVSDVAELRVALIQTGRPVSVVTRWHDDMRLVLASIAGMAAILTTVYLFVLPPVADAMARRLPDAALDIPSEAAEQWLERFFEPTELSPQRVDELRALLGSLELPDVPDRRPLRLEFRRSALVGANALALPSGLIVMTDELVALSTDDRALLGVLAHEVGHIDGRHALRRLIKDSAVGLVLAGLLGDINGALLFVPTAFLTTRHSREFEEEADAFAIDVLTRMGVSTAPMADLFAALPHSDEDAGYLSTHPPTPERVGRLRSVTR